MVIMREIMVFAEIGFPVYLLLLPLSIFRVVFVLAEKGVEV
jgi:hypothetical protein